LAGSGRRVFQPGEVLTASNVMNYLQDQAVQVYAGTAARGSAIGTAVSEGMVTYQKDTDQITFYDGTAWQQVYPSKIVTGSVIQTVAAYKTTIASWASTSWGAFHQATITPKYSTSKILVIYTMNVSVYTAGWGVFGRLVRDTTPIYIGDVAGTRTQASNHIYTSNQATILPANGMYLDSPATTSATTYYFQVATQNASYPAVLNRIGVDGDSVSNPSLASHITLLEIAG